MIDTIVAILDAPMTWVFLGLGLVFGLILQMPMPKDPKRLTALRATWVRRNYWAVMLSLGLILGGLAVFFYLFEIAGAVIDMVDRLRETAETAPAEDLRNLGTATAALLAALAAAATLIFQLVRVWIVERQTSTAEQGHITDLINKAVEGLGSEKTTSRIGRVVRGYARIEEFDEFFDDETEIVVPDGAEIVDRVETTLSRGEEEFLDGTRVSFRRYVGEDTIMEWQGEPSNRPTTWKTIEIGDWQTFNRTEPNLEVRIGAIYALERIAAESLEDHVRIMEILCAYVRHNSPASSAMSHDLGPWPTVERALSAEDQQRRDKQLAERSDALRTWAKSLKNRDDIQTVMDVIGRRNEKQRQTEFEDLRQSSVGYRLNLRSTNLQALKLSNVNLSRAIFGGSRLEGVFLSDADLSRASFTGAHLEGASLEDANLSGASLRNAFFEAARLRRVNAEGAYFMGAFLFRAYMGLANLKKANFSNAHLQGATLNGANAANAFFNATSLDDSTSFFDAEIQGVIWRNIYLGTAQLTQEQLRSSFGDRTVTVPDGSAPPQHWPNAALNYTEFFREMYKWRENPASYVPPQDRP